MTWFLKVPCRCSPNEEAAKPAANRKRERGLYFRTDRPRDIAHNSLLQPPAVLLQSASLQSRSSKAIVSGQLHCLVSDAVRDGGFKGQPIMLSLLRPRPKLKQTAIWTWKVHKILWKLSNHENWFAVVMYRAGMGESTERKMSWRHAMQRNERAADSSSSREHNLHISIN